MASQAVPDVVISHWSTLIENFQASPLSFYTAVEAALGRRQIVEARLSRVDYREAGLLSANREYLRVTREKLVFDVCAAPFGTGFFVSCWLADDSRRLHPVLRTVAGFALLIIAGIIVSTAGVIQGLVIIAVMLFGGLAVVQAKSANGEIDDSAVVMLPFIGFLYLRLFKPATYYRIDTMLMFQKAVHNSVLEVVDTMTAEKGLRALSEAERKPTMREFYGGRAA